MGKNEVAKQLIAEKFSDELYHHGILNMSWGVRNGPPYPLTGAAKKMSSFLRKKKRQYVIASRAKTAAKEQKKQDAINLKKQKMLAKGDMKAISKNSNLFTNDELAMALQRNQLMLEARHAPNRRKAPDPHAFDRLVNTTEKLGTAAKNLAPALDVAMKVADLTKKRIDAKSAESDRATKQVTDRINMLKGLDDSAALDLFNQLYDTKYEKSKKPKFEKDRFEALKDVSPNAAAEYLSKALGYTVSYDLNDLAAYRKAIGNQGGKKKKNQSSGGGSDNQDDDD